MTDAVSSGSCLCGAVAFEITGFLRPVIACHCGTCRKVSGNFWAATSARWDRISLTRQDGLRWFQSSETVRRGFCEICGSTLFYEPEGQERLAISAASLDAPTGLRLVSHVFVEEKGDWYDLADGLPCHSGFSGEENGA